MRNDGSDLGDCEELANAVQDRTLRFAPLAVVIAAIFAEPEFFQLDIFDA